MKRYITILFMLLVAGTTAIAQPIEKTLVKTMTIPADVTQILVDVDATVEVVYWDEPTMRIVTEVQADVKEPILKALIKAGRYDYQLEAQAQGTALVAPNQDKQVILSGKALEEEWTILLYLPKGVDYVLLADELPL